MTDYNDSNDENKPETQDVDEKVTQTTKSSDNVVSDERMSVAFKPLEYLTPRIDEFLNAVFGIGTEVEPRGDEHILCWAKKLKGDNRKTGMGYPVDREAMLHSLSRSQTPRALYYCTSVCHMSSDAQGNPALRNTKDAFAALYVVVLDDIGTKIPASDIPLQPSYIIESSKGNFQYGYILDAPIENLNHATALVRAIYNSGGWDSGGAMVTKLVRLPDGYNGKPKAGGDFRVRITDFQPDLLYSPEELLSGLNVQLDWEQVLAGKMPTYDANRKLIGMNEKLSHILDYIAGDDMTDVLFNRMIEDRLVHAVPTQDDEWATIECPWADNHTDTGEAGYRTARYSPIGRGEGEYYATRGFKCFHDACKERKTSDFLAEMSAIYADEFYMRDYGTELLGKLVQLRGTTEIRVLSGTEEKLPAPMRQGFKYPVGGNLTSRKVAANLGVKYYASLVAAAKEHKLPRPSPLAVDYWLTHNHRLIADKIVMHPAYPKNTLVELGEGQVGWNECSEPTPHIRPNDYTDDNVYTQRFLEFLRYLIPNNEHYKLVLGIIANKCKDRTFRGYGVLMATPAYGVGRGTLFRILSHLFSGGVLNQTIAKDISIQDLLENQYNRNVLSADALFIHEVGDSADQATSSKQAKDTYTRLKEVMSPQMSATNARQKYEIDTEVYLHFTLFIASQHLSSIAIPEDDRRMLMVRNPTEPLPPEEYTELHAMFIDSEPNLWVPYVREYLIQYANNMTAEEYQALVSRPPMDETKRQMAKVTGTAPTRIMKAVRQTLEDFGVYTFTTPFLKSIIEELSGNPHLRDEFGEASFAVAKKKAPTQIQVLLYDYRFRMPVHEKFGISEVVRPAILVSRTYPQEVLTKAREQYMQTNTTPKELRTEIKDLLLDTVDKMDELYPQIIEAITHSLLDSD